MLNTILVLVPGYYIYTLPGTRLGCYILSYNMYQYMPKGPKTWRLQEAIVMAILQANNTRSLLENSTFVSSKMQCPVMVPNIGH